MSITTFIDLAMPIKTVSEQIKPKNLTDQHRKERSIQIFARMT